VPEDLTYEMAAELTPGQRRMSAVEHQWEAMAAARGNAGALGASADPRRPRFFWEEDLQKGHHIGEASQVSTVGIGVHHDTQ
jgi:hypothetical protein